MSGRRHGESLYSYLGRNYRTSGDRVHPINQLQHMDSQFPNDEDESAGGDLDELRERLDDTVTELRLTQDQLSSTTRSLQQWQASQLQLERHHDDLKAQCIGLQHSVNSLNATCAELKDSKGKLKTRYAELDGFMNKLQTKYNKLKKTKPELTEQNTALQARCDRREAQVSDLEKRLEISRTSLIVAQAGVSAQKLQIITLRLRAETTAISMNQQSDRLKTLEKAAKASAEDRREQQLQAETAYRKLEENEAALAEERQQHEADSKHYQASLSVARKSAKDFSDRFRKLERHVQDQDQELACTKTVAKDCRGQVESLQKDKLQLEKQIQTVLAKVSTVFSEKVKVEQLLKAMKAELG